MVVKDKKELIKKYDILDHIQRMIDDDSNGAEINFNNSLRSFKRTIEDLNDEAEIFEDFQEMLEDKYNENQNYLDEKMERL